MAKGFYTTSSPVDSSYNEHLVISIALPRGSGELIARIKQGLIFVFAACGIDNSGKKEPAQALLDQTNLNTRKGHAA